MAGYKFKCQFSLEHFVLHRYAFNFSLIKATGNDSNAVTEVLL